MCKRWIFFADAHGTIPMGSSGQMVVPADVARSARKLLELAKNFTHNRRGRVYMMPEWTQNMCELSPHQFNEYIASHGSLIYRAD